LLTVSAIIEYDHERPQSVHNSNIKHNCFQ